MRLPRVSLARLMGVILYCGLVFGSLCYATALWASALFTLMLVLLLGAALVAALSSGHSRAGWLGFAIFGGGFFLAAFSNWFGSGAGGPPVVSLPALTYFHARAIQAEQAAGLPIAGVNQIYALVQNNAPSGAWTTSAQPTSAGYSVAFNQLQPLNQLIVTGASPAISPALEDFQRVGQVHATFLCALLGAAVGRRVQRRRERMAGSDRSGQKDGTPSRTLSEPETA
jgi:hypothetical protein